MECFRCHLRFNTLKRKPYLLSCLHNVCHHCLSKIQCCWLCAPRTSQAKDMNLDNAKLNSSILQIVNGKQNDYDKTIKICVLGNSKVGKSSVINLMKGQQFASKYQTTVGYQYSFSNKKLSKNTIRYQIWDTAGNVNYRPTSQLHLKNVDIFLIIYDLSKTSQENQVSKWIELAQRNSKKLDELKKSQIILAGNKADLRQNVVKSISNQEWKQIAMRKYQHIQITCAQEDSHFEDSPDYQSLWNSIQTIVDQNLTIKRENNGKDKQLDQTSTDQSLDLQKQIDSCQTLKTVEKIFNNPQTIELPQWDKAIFSRTIDQINKQNIEASIGLNKKSKVIKIKA